MAHFQLLIPNYDDAFTFGHAPLSYLRLGQNFTSADDATIAPTERGREWIEAELASSRPFYEDDERHVNGWNKPASDMIYRRLSYDGASEETATDPRPWTQQLFSRGGWYEHTDGNRISTTRGDSVEVIGGNYRMIVMGRVEGAHVGRSHWESSGGHDHVYTSTPGEVTSIKWAPGVEGDTWEVTSTLERGNVVSYFQGRRDSQYFGPLIHSEVRPGADATKSFNTERPTLREEIYAKSVTSTTKASSITQDTTILEGGVVRTYKDAPTINSFTGAVLGKEVHQAKSSLHADQIETKHAFDNRYLHSVGMISIGVSMADQLNKYKGAKFEFNFSATTSLQLAFSGSVNVGAGIALAIGKTDDFTFAPIINVKLAMIAAGTLVSLAVAAYEGMVAYAEYQAAANSTHIAAATFMGPC
jgi:hypothetical protein